MTDDKKGSDIESERKGSANVVRLAFFTELAKSAPNILIALCILTAVALLRQPITDFLSRSTEIGLGPVTLKSAEAKLGQVKIDSQAGARYFSSDEIGTLTQRYSEALAGGRRAGILWVDDNPQNNKDMVDFLDVIGVTVVVARSYEEAVLRLEERSFNVVVSDWSRPTDQIEQAAQVAHEQFWGSGAQLAKLMAENGCGRKVVLFSAGSTDDMPIAPGVAAQTNRYYDLLINIANGIQTQAKSCDIES